MPTPTRPVTPDDVQEIAPGITDDPANFWPPFIQGAHAVINDLAVSACGASLSPESLFEAERWLAAHFASTSSKTPGSIIEEDILKGDIRVRYSVAEVQPGINGSTYGQTANVFANGCLGLKGQPGTQAIFV